MLNIFRSLWLYTVSVTAVIIIGLLIILIGIFDKRKTYTGRLTNIWAKWICIFSRFKIYTEGLENLDLNKQYIFISNHESILDIPIVLSQLPFNIIFLTKKELFKVPFFGWAIYLAGMISVDRKNSDNAKQSVDFALKSISENDINILVYPEGTRSNPGKLLPFKTGSFILAIHSGLPIVPITTINTGKNLPKSAFFLRNKSDIKVIIDKPIITKGMDPEKDKKLLCSLTYKMIKNNLY